MGAGHEELGNDFDDRLGHISIGLGLLALSGARRDGRVYCERDYAFGDRQHAIEADEQMTHAKNRKAMAHDNPEKHFYPLLESIPTTDEDEAILKVVNERLADPQRVKVSLDNL
jgi:hypothetical protein